MEKSRSRTCINKQYYWSSSKQIQRFNIYFLQIRQRAWSYSRIHTKSAGENTNHLKDKDTWNMYLQNMTTAHNLFQMIKREMEFYYHQYSYEPIFKTVNV